ncbi:MAG: N4-gp56 family major capsid protein [Bacteroidetes bacterium]|nr:N4-gp56 family major capsid protein [Bacteroidota bacterium]
MATMTRGLEPQVIETYNVRKTLEFAKPKLVYPQFGQPDMIMKRKSDTASWLRFNKLSVPSSTLSDNPTWSPSTVTESKVTAQLDFWGNGVELVEFLEQTSFLDLPDEYKKLIGQNAGETINEKVRDVYVAGLYATYPNSRTGRHQLISTDYADMDVFTNAAMYLEDNDAPKIGDSYVAIIRPFVKGRLLENSSFRNAVQLRKDSLFTGELVDVGGVRFVVTSTAPTVTNQGSQSTVATIDQSIVLGDGAVGIARLMPGDFKVVVTPPGGHGDEYAVKTSIAWKCYLKAVRLIEEWMYRVETAR